MKTLAGLSVILLVLIGVVVVSLDGASEQTPRPAATPATYHEIYESQVASPGSARMPLPRPEDMESASVMTSAGITMIQVSQRMAANATTMAASTDPALVELGAHWARDAAALRERGLWMIASATSATMVHDPDKARQLDLLNLQGNGLAMAAEGQAMAAHGQEMVAQIEQLRNKGNLPPETAGELIAAGNALVAAGERLAQDGERMQQYAERLSESLGA